MKLITAYLKSKEIYSHLVKDFKQLSDNIFIIKIESTTDNKTYEVLIDLNHLIFSCECHFFVNQLSLKDFIVINNKKIYVCKHILKALEFLAKLNEEALEFFMGKVYKR